MHVPESVTVNTPAVTEQPTAVPSITVGNVTAPLVVPPVVAIVNGVPNTPDVDVIDNPAWAAFATVKDRSTSGAAE